MVRAAKSFDGGWAVWDGDEFIRWHLTRADAEDDALAVSLAAFGGVAPVTPAEQRARVAALELLVTIWRAGRLTGDQAMERVEVLADMTGGG
jgi:hypothetical protein